MKKTLVIIIVGLSGVIGYQMEQRAKLKASNDELKFEIESLGEVNDELEFAVRSLVFENSNLQDELAVCGELHAEWD